MAQKFAKNATYWLGVVAVGLVVGLGVQFVRAWTEPTVTPPRGNVGAPINTSNLGQTKQGGLILNTGGATNGLIVQNGNVGIGTVNPADTLQVNGTIRGQHVFVDNYNMVAFNGIIWTTSSTTFVDIPQTNKDVTVPAGTALITWQMSACGNGGSVNALVRACINNDCGPTSNPFIAAGPLNDHCDIYNKSFGGSFVTNVTSGTKTVKLQVRRVVGPAGNFKTSADDYVNWSIMVFRQ